MLPCTELRAMIGGTLSAPVATIPIGAWNSERLQTFLREMDVALENRKPERVLTLSYTCMEGFFKAYVEEARPGRGRRERDNGSRKNHP